MSSPLQNLRVANPCPANWDEMEGSETVRHCTHCRLNVYNLSAMTTVQAETLLRRCEGKVCVRFYERGDGTVITRDCPRGLMAARVRLAHAVVFSAGFVVCLYGYLLQRELQLGSEKTWVEMAIDAGSRLPLIGSLIKAPPSPPASAIVPTSVTIGKAVNPGGALPAVPLPAP